MEAGGVGEKAMRGVRKALGLADDDSMRSGTALKNLTRSPRSSRSRFHRA